MDGLKSLFGGENCEKTHQQLSGKRDNWLKVERRGQRVEVEGEIRDVLVRAHKVDVTIAQGDSRLLFSFYHDGGELPAGIENGAYVRVTGILSMFYKLPFYNADGRFSLENLTLNLQSAEDVEVLRPAPLWSPKRVGFS